jgi:aminocarboxymuconate-semialdehyde decarboxylase
MKTIDIHAHWFPAEWVRLMEQDAGRFGGKLQRTPKGYQITTQLLTNVFNDEFVDIDRRLAGMDRTGVAAQLMSLTSPMARRRHTASTPTGSSARRCCRCRRRTSR